MDINDHEIKTLTEFHNKLPDRKASWGSPSVKALSSRRINTLPFLFKTGKMVLAFLFLIFVFTSFSIFMIDSLSGEKQKDPMLVINTEIFSLESPGNLVSAFREVIK